METSDVTPELSVVVPAYNNWWLTERCLHDLDRLRAISPVSFETIVVDNGSLDETPHQLPRFDWIRSLRLETNANFAGAANAGARAAEAPIVLFLNNDAYPLGDALTPIVAAFTRSAVVIAGAALFYEDGVTQGAGCVLLPNAHWFLSCRNLPPNVESVQTSRDAVVVPGAAIAVRRSWFLSGGGFDTAFRNGFEDTDLCMRAHGQARIVRYVAESRFAHYEGATIGRFDWEHENERRFYKRWSSALATIPRTDRGEVSAIVLERSSNAEAVESAVLDDLLDAIDSYGHPIVEETIPLWKRIDRRFRIASGLAWNIDGPPRSPCVELTFRANRTVLRTHGAIELEVPWMPCVKAARAKDLWVQPSLDPECRAIALVGEIDAPMQAAIEAREPDVQFEPIEIRALLARGPLCEVAAAVLGRGDRYGLGALMLAHAGIACVEPNESAPERLVKLLRDPHERRRAGAIAANDAQRCGSPRRCAMRVLDLARVARFGLERPGRAVANAPIRLDDSL